MRRLSLVAAARTAGMVMVAALVLGACGTSASSGVSRAQADHIALTALRSAHIKGPLVVYGLPRPVDGSVAVRQAGVPLPRDRRGRGLAPAGPQWLFFEDLAPGAYFDHPGRLLFVSERSGHVTALISTRSYPVVGDRAPFIEPGVPRRDIVLARPAPVAPEVSGRPAPAFDRGGPGDALPTGALRRDCVLSAVDRGPDERDFVPDVDAVTRVAGSLGVRVFALPARRQGATSAGSEVSAFAGQLAADEGCANILIFLAGQGVERRGIDVGWNTRTSASFLLTPPELRDAISAHRRTTFEVVIDASFSGQFAHLLSSLGNLLVLSVSSSATQPSYGGGVAEILTADGIRHRNPDPSDGAPAGYVSEIVAGWQGFARSAIDIAAAQAAGGSLFARMSAEAASRGGGRDWPASIGATTPLTLAPNLPTAATALSGLRVSGASLVNGHGDIVSLHGVNRSGTEYACIQDSGIFDGPSSAASVAAMAAWHINIVRIPLNEDCWLAVNTGAIKPAYVGQNYIDAIVNYVDLLHHYGMYAELSLIWGAPGSARATYQANAPDEDHSPAMWTSMAETFKDDPDVILAPWGETTVSWSCFMHGCDDEATYGSDQDGDASCGSGCWYYATAGMQQAVTDMRAAGYGGPIAIPCIAVANMCGTLPDGSEYDGSTWLSSKPLDPADQLIAEAHVYGRNTCDTTACFDASMLPILRAGSPVIWAETGETYDYSDCPSTSYIHTFLTWAEQHGVGTEAWAWDAWGGCSTGALISDYDGTPEDAWARYVQSNYQTMFPPDP